MESRLPEGLSVKEMGNVIELLLGPPVGRGFMRGQLVSDHLVAATVDFNCEACPSLPLSNEAFSAFRDPGTLFTVNYCVEGRCEVLIPGQGYAIVRPGDFCVSCTKEAPQEYRYPLGRYRGVEVIAHTACAHDELFSALMLGKSGLEPSVQKAGFAAIFANDSRFNGYMERIGQALEDGATRRLAYECLGLLIDLCDQDLGSARPPMLLTRSQMGLVRIVRNRIEGDLAATWDVRDFADEFGLSASTLNNYFSIALGQTIASYVRRRRLESAASMLAAGCEVATASLRVGYENPSKFAAAFKRLYGKTPTEFRRHARLDGIKESGSGQKRLSE